MKTESSWIATTILTVLLVSFATPLVASTTQASEEEDSSEVKVVPGTWYKLESDIVTVLFPAGGRRPMFIWWYNKAPDQIYSVKYQGLIEYLTIANDSQPSQAEYYNRIREAWQETWRERFNNWYFQPEEDHWMSMNDMYRLMLLRQIVAQIMFRMESRWHMPFFPFDGGRWSLGNIANITTPEGKNIGLSFTFELVDEWIPGFDFVKDNIMIRVRFYNETVEETVPGTGFSYRVNAGEVKMDFVVNEWHWNIDIIKELVRQLREAGFDVQIPETKSRLALWVNLASFNITTLSLPVAQQQPEEIERCSTTTNIEIQDRMEDITQNKTATNGGTPIELSRPKYINLRFANQTKTLGGFFRFVSSAKITDYPNEGNVNIEEVKAAYIAAGGHMRLYIGYPYFGNGTLEHDPSIGVDLPNVDATPKYTVQAPSGSDATPIVIGRYVLPPFATELMIALAVVVSSTAIILYALKWKRKTPVNMVGVGTTG